MADVVGALPAALAGQDIECSVLTPYYPQVYRGEVGRELAAFDVHIGDVAHPVRLLAAEPYGILVDQPTAYERPGVYVNPHTGEKGRIVPLG